MNDKTVHEAGSAPASWQELVSQALKREQDQDWPGAEAAWLAALAEPGVPAAELCDRLAALLSRLGRWQDARLVAEQGVSLGGGAPLLNRLGVILKNLSQPETGAQQWRRAVSLDPGHTAARLNLMQYGQLSGDATLALVQAKALPPGFEPAERSLARALAVPVIPQSLAHRNQVLGDFSARLRTIPPGTLDPARVQSLGARFPAALIYYGRDDRSLRETFAACFKPGEPPVVPRRSQPHLGFVVTDGHEAVFLRCMAGLLERLPPTWQLSLVCNSNRGRQRLQARLPGLARLELAPDFSRALVQLREAAFDLLYYWEIGTDPLNYLLALSQPARRQCTSWGWPVTSGLAGVSHFLSCTGIEPENAQRYYSETLLIGQRLPIWYPFPTVTPPEARAEIRSRLGLRANDCLYVCLQNLRKLQPEIDPLLAAILGADPRSRLLLLDDRYANVTAALQARLQQSLGPCYKQVVWLPQISHTGYLALLAAADLALDSYPYSGGANSNYPAFAAGVPVITLPGPLHRGRFTLAAYKQIGLHECIAANPEDYVAKALELGADPALRTRLGASLRHESRPLFEDPLAATEFAQLLEATLAN